MSDAMKNWSIAQVKQRIQNLDRMECQILGTAKVGFINLNDWKEKNRRAFYAQKPRSLMQVKAGR